MALSSVVVGGAIAIVASVLGAVAGPFAIHKMQRKEADKKLRREKIEEAIGLLFAHRAWVDARMQEKLFGGSPATAPSPLPHAEALIAIYCPACRKPFTDFDVAAAEFEVWLVGAMQRKLAGNVANMLEGYKEVYPPFLFKSSALVKAMAETAGEIALNP